MEENKENTQDLLNKFDALHLNCLNKFDANHPKCGPMYRDHQLQQALKHMSKNELQAIYHLTESHVPGLRERAIYRYDSTRLLPRTLNKKFVEFGCLKGSVDDKITYMLNYLEEMPKEWQIIQITSQYNLLECINRDSKVHFTNPLHICVFNCGQKTELPICLTTQLPSKDGSVPKIEIMQDLKNVECDINSYTHALKGQSRLQYVNKKNELETRLQKLVKQTEDYWLREWKCLFVGKFRDDAIEKDVRNEVEIILKENNLTNVSHKMKIILYHAIKGFCYLKCDDVKNLLNNITEDSKVRLNIYKTLETINKKYNFNYLKTYPILLIIDEKLDAFPWELTSMLENKSVCRMPSLHFTYGLFKEHEKSIIDGFKVIKSSVDIKYIINPDLNLETMQKRLKTFLNYWMPNWSGLAGVKPTPEEFESNLTKSDVFVYCGHGSGIQFLPGNKIECLRVNAVVFLFGCQSMALSIFAPGSERFGTYHTYLIACSPCVLGMLYNVTDFDTDCVATALLSEIFPSEVALHWKYVDKVRWHKQNSIVAAKENPLSGIATKSEPELLEAIIKAKKTANHYLTKAAFVCKGLPVRFSHSRT